MVRWVGDLVIRWLGVQVARWLMSCWSSEWFVTLTFFPEQGRPDQRGARSQDSSSAHPGNYRFNIDLNLKHIPKPPSLSLVYNISYFNFSFVRN